MTTIRTITPEHLGELANESVVEQARAILRQMDITDDADITDAQWDAMLDRLSKDLYA